MTIADVFSKKFIPKVRLNSSTVRGTVTGKEFNREKNTWYVEISATVDAKTYSKSFNINEVIDATDNNGILRID